jgi:plastocyanin
MSIWGRHVSIKLIAVVIVVVIVGALLAAVSRTPSREIVLVARNMAFYLEGDAGNPNPTLTISAGERVRVVLRNEERGFTHDFAVPLIGSRTDLINWNEDAAVTFDAPDRPGIYEYVCEPHAMMMRGQIIVVR